MPDLMTSFNFVLELGGVEMASFRKCSGVESETETIEYKEATKDGRMIIRKVPGAMKWSDITLERRIDESKALWEWHQAMLQGKVSDARRDGSVILKSYDGSEVARYNFTNAWISKISTGNLKAGANEVLMEEASLVCESFERA